MSTYTIRVWVFGEHDITFTCDEDEVDRWHSVGRIVSRAEQDEIKIQRYFNDECFIIRHPNSTEYISPMDVKLIQIIKNKE